MSARDSILARLRATPPATLPALPDVAAWFDSHQRNENNAQRINRLRSALEAVKTEVHDTTADAWQELLLQIAAAKGLRNKEIAKDLGISERTVQAHLSNIFSKLGVDSRTEAVLKALKNGWLDLSDLN